MEVEKTLKSDLWFLSRGGEMGQFTREKDWSKTIVGAPDLWPQSLRTTLGILLNSNFPMFLWWGPELTCFYNDAYRPSLGKDGKHPSILGMPAIDAWPEIWDIIKPLIDKVMNEGESIWFEDMLVPIYRNGKIEDVYWTFSYSPVPNDFGQVSGVLVTCNETTEKVNALRKLEESNARYINNIMQAPVAMCILRGENYVVEIANKHMLEIWGKEEEQVMNKPIFEGLPEAKDQGLEPLLNHVFKTGEKFVANERAVNLPRNGKVETTYLNFVYEALKEADGSISGIAAIATDVTQQVKSRAKVEESEQKVRTIVENAPFPIAVYSGKEMIVELANQSIIDIWGKGNDVIGKSFKEVLPELDNQLVFEQITSVLKNGESFHTKNTPLDLVVDGKSETFYFNYSLTPLYDIGGNVYGVLNTGVDLTELNIAKKKIEEADKLFRTTVKQAPVGIIILRGPEYIVEMANDAYLKLVDRKEDEFVGRRLFESLPEVEASVHSLMDSVLNTGIPYHGNEVPIPINRFGKQEVCYFDFLYYPLKEDDGQISGIIVTVNEVSEKVEARKKIEDSEKRYNLMLMQSPFAFLILKGKNLVVHLANESMKEVLGKGSDIEGKPLLEVLPELKGQAFPGLLDNVYNTGIAFSANEMLAKLTRNGILEDVYFNYVYQPYYEADNTISGVTVIAYDVTSSVIANKKIEASEEKLNIVIEASELGTWELNLKTREAKYSQRYLEIVGGYKDYIELTHDQLLQHLHPDDMHIRENAFKDALKKGYLHFQARLIWKDKSIHWMEGRGKVFYDNENNPEKMIGTIRDITDVKSHEQELDKLVKERTVQLERSNEDLQQFAHVASHDLKEPLRKIKIFTNRIKEEYADTLSAPVTNFLEKILSASSRMQMMVDGVLSFSSLNSMEQPIQKIDLNRTIKNLKGDLEIFIEQKQATIISDDLPVIEGGEVLINQLFYNLLQNALKFSEENEAPKIEISSSIFNEEGQDFVKILVKDNGIGFDQNNAEKIFETFARLNSKDVFEGTGLGLSLCKKIVERHNGSIEARSKETEGTTFIITLPLKQTKTHI